jgi:hypothetical protein
MANHKSRLALAILLLVGCSAALSGQELSSLRHEVRTPRESTKPAPMPKERRRRDGSKKSSLVSFSSGTADCDDDEEDTLSEFFGSAFLAGLSSPFWAPRAVIGDDTLEPGYFLRYPYLHDRDGALSPDGYSVGSSRTWMLRSRGEYATDFDSLSKIGGALLFETASRWGIDSEFNYRREEIAPSNDSLWTGDANLVYRFAQSEQLLMRTGIGLNWLADQSENDLGFNFTYAGDWFPTQPIIISHEIDWGKLGHASLFHGRITAGVNYHRLEVYTGYDYFDVGNTEISGMVGGVRLWLSH